MSCVALDNKKGRDRSRPSCLVVDGRVKPGHHDVVRSVRGALRWRGGPRLDQGVVVDGFALRLLVRKFALGRDGVVLFGPGEPELGLLLLVELRTESALHAGLLKPR